MKFIGKKMTYSMLNERFDEFIAVAERYTFNHGNV